jgi:hypothetical protein
MEIIIFPNITTTSHIQAGICTVTVPQPTTLSRVPYVHWGKGARTQHYRRITANRTGKYATASPLRAVSVSRQRQRTKTQPHFVKLITAIKHVTLKFGRFLPPISPLRPREVNTTNPVPHSSKPDQVTTINCQRCKWRWYLWMWSTCLK